jgi:hypothetical protein
MIGTASPTRRWLLVEHPGPWAIAALDTAGIAPARQALAAAVSTSGGRVLLVRRHGRQPGGPARRWIVIDHVTGPVATGTWADDGSGRPDAGLLDAAAALAAGGSALPSTETVDLPVLLVCAHGRHDVCCAVRGRPVAAALAARWPGQTWECSHVGGDRFAANLVVVPDGVYYGGVEAGDAIDVVERHLTGRVDVDHLRGFTTMPPPAQAAAAAAHRRWGPAGPRAVTVDTVTTTAEDRWHVELTGSDGLPARVVAEVSRSLGAPARLTCRASRDAVPGSFEVISLVAVAD